MQILYWLRLPGDLYKFGTTNRSLSARYAGENVPYIVVAKWQMPDAATARQIEAGVKRRFAFAAYRGADVFKRTGTKELLHMPNGLADEFVAHLTSEFEAIWHDVLT